MATVNRNRLSRIHPNKSKTDFSKVGGLANHIKLLREIIILPLLYGDLYHHFNIKAPRGVIFYGPPGTGKTLVAGALANELNKEGNGKVSFFQRKGADILDKWVGESERKLRELFEKATKARPSVIFFDELDGLAPERSIRNDQVHSSVVATLLALMDGLDNMSGVIVIGATNRIDSIDPALRRPGRFDRELYFPLPCINARKDILQVHMRTWKHKPNSDFLNHLAELTTGMCGSDLQALCAEAVLCSLKRKYPTINQKPKINIEVESIRVEEQDFLNARLNITPTSQRLGNCKMRRLSAFIQPLLQRQIDKIVRHIEVLLPHFTQVYRKFLVGNERYAGRLVLKGSAQQGLNTHVVPALLQTLEHLQSYVLDIPGHYKKVISSAIHNFPSILVLSRVDDWWDVIDNNIQMSISSMLDDIHAGLPVLLIATCNKDLPEMLQDHFHYNSSIVMQLEDPTFEEREKFFAPLFFGNKILSVFHIWKEENHPKVKEESDEDDDESKVVTKQKIRLIMSRTTRLRGGGGGKRRHSRRSLFIKPDLTRIKHSSGRIHRFRESESRRCMNSSLAALQECYKTALNYARTKFGVSETENCKSVQALRHHPSAADNMKHRQPSTAVTDLVNCKNIMTPQKCVSKPKQSSCNVETLYYNKGIKRERESDYAVNIPKHSNNYNELVDTTDNNVDDIYSLWKRVSNVTSDGLPVVQLELLYDTILACIYINKNSFKDVFQGLENTLNNFESSCSRDEY